MFNKILLVDNEIHLTESLERFLFEEGYDVITCINAENALEILDDQSIDLIITDIMLQGINGIELLKIIKNKKPEIPVIITTAYASLETAVESLRGGAADYITKPIIYEELKQVIRKILKNNKNSRENISRKGTIAQNFDFKNIIGQNNEFIKILEDIKKIAKSRSNVLIVGETGTGKELIARAIHNNSYRVNQPFIPINCSAIPENLFESELFGHIKGSFTGALITKKGLFEEANGGTVFLDEIADLSLPLQAKLLRVIEDREIRPVGSNQSNKIDIRFITATSKDIFKETLIGRFRDDLYYRINVITIKLPSLKDRKEDIVLLINYFINKYSKENGKKISEITPEAIRILVNYGWPGNIRELQNIIERAVLLCENEVINEALIKDYLKDENLSIIPNFLDSKLSITDYTRSFIIRYEKTHSEQEIADMLGITRKSLWEKRKKWGLIRKNYN